MDCVPTNIGHVLRESAIRNDQMAVLLILKIRRAHRYRAPIEPNVAIKRVQTHNRHGSVPRNVDHRKLLLLVIEQLHVISHFER